MAIEDALIIHSRMARPGPAGATILPSEWTAAQTSISLLQIVKADKSWAQHRVLTSAVGPLEWPLSPGWLITDLAIQSAPANSTWLVRWHIGDYSSGSDSDGITWEVNAPSGTTVNLSVTGNETDAPSPYEQSPIVAVDTSTARQYLTGADARGAATIEGVIKVGAIGGSITPSFRTASGGSCFIRAERSTLWAQRMS